MNDNDNKLVIKHIYDNYTFMSNNFKKQLKHLLAKKLYPILDNMSVTKIRDKKHDFIILIGDSSFKLELFCVFIMFYYYINLTKKEKLHVSIDFEFNHGKIALMQLNFGHIGNNKYIWIIDPKMLDTKQNKIIIEILLTNTKIYKILHGADSLDIPYMYEQLFKGNKEHILKFTKKMIDTRFLCEYYRTSMNDIVKKCSLYDALKYFDVINNTKYEELDNIHKKMGPIHKINWSVYNLKGNTLLYTAYDVIYLGNLLHNIYKHVIKNTNFLAYSYKFINPLIRFIYLERRGITNITNDAKNVTDPMNSYFVYKNKMNVTFGDIFNEIMNKEIKLYPNKKDNSKYINLNFILSVNYFKKYFITCFRNIVYYHLINKYTVYVNKNEKSNVKINLKHMYDNLEKNGFIKILELLQLFEQDENLFIYI